VATSELRQHSTAILHAAGLALDVAELVADSLVDAEVRGIGSHGVTRTRIYSERLRAGMIDASAQPEIEQSSPGRIQVNAKNAIGHLGARTGIDAAVEMAAENFVGVAGVADSNHCGTLAYFARRAAERGFLAIAMSTAPPTMIYFGGRTRAVGTNPIAFAVPRPDGPPIVVDMATSATARGKIILSNRLGKDIPPGWAVDAEGKPTTDAAAALLGSVVPFGGPKGSGLAMMIDLFAGALVGGLSGPDIGDMYEDYTRPQHVSHLFLVLNPDGWVGKEAFDEHVAEFVKRVRTLPPADGVDRILLPGELEHGRWEEAERNGAVLESIVFDDLNDIAAELGIDRRVTAMDGWES
jgi:LDH2 family malate/lactate/ureidoglycolate dehydrogenase